MPRAQRTMSQTAHNRSSSQPMKINVVATPFWDHPRVVVVPHVASMTIARGACEFVIDNIRRFEAGQPLRHVVDLDKGY